MGTCVSFPTYLHQHQQVELVLQAQPLVVFNASFCERKLVGVLRNFESKVKLPLFAFVLRITLNLTFDDVSTSAIRFKPMEKESVVYDASETPILTFKIPLSFKSPNRPTDQVF